MNRFLAGIAAAMLGLGVVSTDALAETPPDQLVVATSLANVLTLDPADIVSREGAQVMNAVYETLVQIDPHDRSRIIPGLAESWEISEDGRSITFHLREANFASGNPVTAADVVWSLTRLMSMNLAQASFLKTRGFTAETAAESFVALDERTFRLNLPKPDDPRLVMMVLAVGGTGAVIDHVEALRHEVDGDLAQGWLRLNSAGSGPYVVREWRSNELILLERNPNYWGEAPAMRRVLMRHLPESQTQRLQLERGDIDIGYSLLSADLQGLEANPDVVVASEPSAGFYYLGVSMKDERFANPLVRRALAHLIDYEGLNRSVMPYFGQPHQRPIAAGVMGALPDPGYRLDVETARALLAEAGYPDGFDVTLRALAEPPFINIATALQATLAQAGIRAEIITGSGDQIYGAMRERNFELIVGRGGGGTIPHPDSNLRALVYNPDNSDEAALTNFQGWRTSFHDEELNRMIDEALLVLDPEEQREAYEAIQIRYDELAPSLMIFSQVVVSVAYRDDVEGLIIDPWHTRFQMIEKHRE
ncbi:ABC-type dipeptide transport system, periplasmic component [Rubellimicrobium thermophilum DSM 16684]|uniref:ABC-type dipeptide transport system, periplasmic component n=1 Tax=Rubellimicrobium thermophilum DSM 16684 TaxID=1123069 RepID=S9SC06_9RHOB|nr:ABC transporter substrate-binding protein [Rubellimicrobium thermophilum]EPX87640.1 ABC-type dipeptide transport system, periplasmic component [Rubellimicrobium thermophilum DSM 16684]